MASCLDLNHHVNHIIMSITSSSICWEVWAIRNAWIHGWKHSRAQNPVFFSGKVAVRGRRWRVSVSAVSRLDRESGRQNVHEIVARARFHKKKRKKKTRGSGHFHFFQAIHFNSFMSSHSFQFIRFNAFVSSHSRQFINFNSVISFIQFNWFESIASLKFHCFNWLMSLHSLQVTRFNSFMSIHSLQ